MQRTKDILKTWYERGDKPTEVQFSDLIDSFNQTIANEETFQQENLEDGSSHVIQCALVVDLGEQPYTPWEASKGFEFIVAQDNVFDLIQKHRARFPIHVKYKGNGAEYVWPVLVKADDDSIVLQAKITDRYEDTVSLFVATIGSDNQIHVKFLVGQYIDDDQIRAVQLEGFIAAPDEKVTAADSILAAFGKLQAQINGLDTRVKVLEEAPPETYLVVMEDEISIPSDGTAQEVQIVSNGDWEVTEV